MSPQYQEIFLTQGSNPSLLSPALASGFFTTSVTLDPFKSKPYYSVSLTVANSIRVFSSGLFLCFKTLIFFFHLSDPTYGFSVHQVFKYAQTLIVGKLKCILTGLLKFTIVVCIFMFPVWDYHFTIATRFFQYLVCMEMKDPRG